MAVSIISCGLRAKCAWSGTFERNFVKAEKTSLSLSCQHPESLFCFFSHFASYHFLSFTLCCQFSMHSSHILTFLLSVRRAVTSHPFPTLWCFQPYKPYTNRVCTFWMPMTLTNHWPALVTLGPMVALLDLVALTYLIYIVCNTWYL